MKRGVYKLYIIEYTQDRYKYLYLYNKAIARRNQVMSKNNDGERDQYYNNKGQEDKSYDPPHVPAFVPVESERSQRDNEYYDKGWGNK